MNDPILPSPKIITIERHILQEQPASSKGDLTHILQQIALAGKIIAHQTTRAGLSDILGDAGIINVQGERVQKLDLFSNQVMYQLHDHIGCLAMMGSEENEDIIPIPEYFPVGRYILLFDPLDGSSNIEFNVSVGTIFTIFQIPSGTARHGKLEDTLQGTKDIVAAGYIIYGSSTMMVYSLGNGLNGFTLDPSIGEFLLSHPNIKIPESPKYYSVNQANYQKWSSGVRRYTEWLEENQPKLSLRYIGSMVADVHRTLLSGGVFYYPADSSYPSGKLRFLFEVAPMSFLVEQAGGYASTGTKSVSDLIPTSLHERCPVFLGNTDLVTPIEKFIADEKPSQ